MKKIISVIVMIFAVMSCSKNPIAPDIEYSTDTLYVFNTPSKNPPIINNHLFKFDKETPTNNIIYFDFINNMIQDSLNAPYDLCFTLF